MDFSRRIKQIGTIEVEEVLTFWTNFTHSLEFPITLPIQGLESNPQLIQACKDSLNDEKESTNKNHFYTIEGIQSHILQESIVLTYKGLNFLNGIGLNLQNGMQTLPLINSYQSSFFIAKGLLAILGVSIIRVENKDFIINLLPNYSKKVNKSEKKRRREDFELRIIPIKQIQHFELWELLQKVLNNLKFKSDQFNDQVSKYISSLDKKVFAKQRNENIYFSNYWSFEDLKNQCSKLDKFIKKVIGEDQIELSTTSEYFTFSITYLLLRLPLTIFEELANYIPSFNQEYEKFNNLIISESNILYKEFIQMQE